MSVLRMLLFLHGHTYSMYSRPTQNKAKHALLVLPFHYPAAGGRWCVINREFTCNGRGLVLLAMVLLPIRCCGQGWCGIFGQNRVDSGNAYFDWNLFPVQYQLMYVRVQSRPLRWCYGNCRRLLHCKIIIIMVSRSIRSPLSGVAVVVSCHCWG